MPIYTVTFCSMDHETGTNMMWHSCLLLSKFDEQSKKLEVVDNWGFYAIPSTDTDSIFSKIKMKVRLDLDFIGNHGMLRHEEIRYLDMGCGLHGVTFELTETKFNALQKRCEEMADGQNKAIEEIVKFLDLRGKEPEKTRVYPYENISMCIYEFEKALSRQQHRAPRLRPFELTPFGTANNCKLQILKLLEGILAPEQITRLTGLHRVVPRWSGKTERIFLHSSGPTHEHKKSSGRVVLCRDGEDKNVKLHWTIPPQEIETLSDQTRDLFKINKALCKEAKKMARHLQKLEWLFMNAFLPPKNIAGSEKLIACIRAHYEVFAIIKPKEAKASASSLTSFAKSLSLFSRDNDEILWQKNISNAKYLIDCLYETVAKDWSSFAEEKQDKSDEVKSLAGLAAYLPLEKKKDLCVIIEHIYGDSKSEMSLAFELVASGSQAMLSM